MRQCGDLGLSLLDVKAMAIKACEAKYREGGSGTSRIYLTLSELGQRGCYSTLENDPDLQSKFTMKVFDRKLNRRLSKISSKGSRTQQ